MPFPLQVACAFALLVLVITYPVLRFGTTGTIEAVCAGAVLATFNVLAGYAAIRRSLGKSATVFLRYVLGGMGIRMAVLAVALIVLIRVFSFDALTLVGSLGVFYVVFLALEILYIQHTVSAKQQ